MKHGILVLAIFAICVCGQKFCLGADVEMTEKQWLEYYIESSDSFNTKVFSKLKPEAILKTAERLKSLPETADKIDYMSRLSRAIIYLQAPENIKSEGKAVLYSFLKSKNKDERIAATDYISHIDGEKATDTFLTIVDDPIEEVRVNALRVLGERGRLDVAATIENILERRARGLSAEDIRRDYTFRHGRAAIEKLKERIKLKPAVANEADAPALAPTIPPPPAAVPSETPITLPTPTMPIAQTPVPVIEHRAPMWPWLVGVAALGLLAFLRWNRHP